MDWAPWLKEFWAHGPYAFFLLLLLLTMWRIGRAFVQWAQPKVDDLLRAYITHVEQVSKDLKDTKDMLEKGVDDIGDIKMTIGGHGKKIDDIHTKIMRNP